MKKWKLLCILLFFILFFYSGYCFYMSLMPTLDSYGELQLRQFTSAVIVHEKRAIFTSCLDDQSIVVRHDENGNIESIDYDLISIMQQTDEMVARTESTIKEVQIGEYKAKDDSRYEKYLESISEKDGIITTIPLESLISFPPVSFLHCRIPVRFQVESNVIGKVIPKIESYGINTTLVKVCINISMQQRMLLPFFHEIKTIEIEFPITMKIIQGKIPNTYFGGS